MATFRCFVGLSFLAVVAAPTLVHSQALTAADFFAHSAVDEIKISPDGTHLALSLSGDEESQLLILNLNERRRVASFNTLARQKVGEFHWVNNERIVFDTLVFRGGFDFPFRTGDIYGLNIDNSEKFQLVGQSAGSFRFSHLIPDDSEHIRVVRRQVRGTSTARSRPHSFRLDVYASPNRFRPPYSNQFSNQVASPLPWGDLHSDNQGVPRLAVANDESNKTRVSYRIEGDWNDIDSTLSPGGHALQRFQFVGFMANNTQFYYLAESESGIRGLYRYIATENQAELLYQHTRFDLNFRDLVFASDGTTILGAKLFGDILEQVYFSDDSEVDLHQSLDATFPGELVTISSFTRDSSKAVVGVFGPRRWGDFFLFDTVSRSIELIYSRSERLRPEDMAEVTPFTITAEDGLLVHGYITEPAQVSGPNPLIVLPHDGPIGVRDYPLFNREAQFLAYNGYSVLQVNFRGSSGYGREFRRAGHRQWGRGIIDDISQATRWAIQSGAADPDSICIYGRGFGAYAALTSLVRQPEMHRCAIGYAGIYDLTRMDDTSIFRQPGGEDYLKKIVGDDLEQLRAQSPLLQTDKIRVPVLLAHGGRDRRAPPSHARELRRALEDQGLAVKWVYEPNEDHGFYNRENAIGFYEALLAFLNQNLRPGSD